MKMKQKAFSIVFKGLSLKQIKLSFGRSESDFKEITFKVFWHEIFLLCVAYESFLNEIEKVKLL